MGNKSNGSAPLVVVVQKSWGMYEDYERKIERIFIGSDAAERAARYLQMRSEEEARRDGMWEAFEKMMDAWERENPYPSYDEAREKWHRAKEKREEELTTIMGLNPEDRSRNNVRIDYSIDTDFTVEAT